MRRALILFLIFCGSLIVESCHRKAACPTYQEGMDESAGQPGKKAKKSKSGLYPKGF